MTLDEMLKRAKKTIGTPPCEMGYCNEVRIKLCADNSIGCKAWRYYVNTGRVSHSKFPINKFRDTVCDRCDKVKDGCEKKCPKGRWQV